ncbi:MAG: UvrD-helicase domain-containing protein [Oscillospiraceae bacterium]|jgi:ATP-dependent helicase/nuclease subunit A|nr:UvrD-helicase domain-containing protein [Oscillospiraceae bacterium]
MNFTPEQQTIINRKGTSAAVYASAGSGKTAVLVEHLAKIIADESANLPADTIVAVTFTEKAAAELSERLEKRLSELVSEHDDAYLSLQLKRLPDARISTIHSLCASILRRFPEESEAGDFAVCDEARAAEFRREALTFAMESLYDSKTFSESELSALNLVSAGRENDLTAALTSLSNTLANIPDQNGWLDTNAAVFDNYKTYFDKIFAVFTPLFQNKQREYYNEAHTLADKLFQQLKSYPTAQAVVESDLSLIASAFRENWKEKPTFSRANYNELRDDPDFKEEIKKTRDNYKRLTEKLCNHNKLLPVLVNSFDEARILLAPAVAAFVKMYRVFAAKLRELLTAENLLTFDDLQHYTLNLLNKSEEAAAELRGEISLIAVDEFQDSNELQFQLFRLLSHNEQNIVVVGDVKQSIYRFRRAEPKVFIDLKSHNKFVPLYLSGNFRSADEVIWTVNDVMSHNMTADFGGVDYKGGEVLRPMLGIAGEPTELVVLEQDDVSEENYIAARIEELVCTGFAFVDKSGQTKRLDYGDIAILASSLDGSDMFGDKMAEALRSRGIPASREKGGGYTASREVAAALDFFTAAVNPYDDFALFSAMLSPIGGFSLEEIAALRLDKRFSLIVEVRRDKTDKSKGFAALLDSVADSARENAASDIISRCVDDGVFSRLIASSPYPKKALANLRLLAAHAGNFGANNSLSDSLRRFKSQSLPGAGGSGGAVNILTIHKAKGLEFPLVFLAKAAKSYNREEERGNMLFDGKIGFAFRYIHDNLVPFETMAHKTAVWQAEQDAKSEELRKLYVALTRARNKLIITAKAPPKGHCYLNLIRKASHFKEISPSLSFKSAAANAPVEAKAPVVAEKFVYSREPLTEIPRKFTVTQIGIEHETVLKNKSAPTVFPKRPSFIAEKRPLSGKERGDAYHKAMLLLDFKSNESVQSQLERIKHRFSPQEFHAVSPDLIEQFLCSPLGDRVKKSAKIYKEFPIYTETAFADIGKPELDSVFPNEKPFVQGIADMFFEENGEIILVDYKTNRNSTARLLTAKYAGQLKIYTRAVSEMTGLRVRERFIWAFDLGTAISI